ncbi:MAG: hypothetical protein ACMXYK_04585 [Candidatus Woesearchaeota archaeon]
MTKASHTMLERDMANQPYQKALGGDLKKKRRKGEAVFPETYLNFKGDFSLEMLYKLMYETLVKLGYTDEDGAKDKFEHYFYEKRAPDGTKSEIWFWWRTKRDSSKVKSDNFEYRIDINVQILGLKESTVVRDGNKFKLNYGELSLFLKPELICTLDTNKIPPPLSWFKDWWEARVFKERYDERKDELYKQANTLYAVIKQYLQLENYVSVPPSFQPELGVPQYKL